MQAPWYKGSVARVTPASDGNSKKFSYNRYHDDRMSSIASVHVTDKTVGSNTGNVPRVAEESKVAIDHGGAKTNATRKLEKSASHQRCFKDETKCSNGSSSQLHPSTTKAHSAYDETAQTSDSDNDV